MALLATPGESEERRIQAATGRLFFGYFLLAEQKKVSRLRGETSIQASVAAATP